MRIPLAPYGKTEIIISTVTLLAMGVFGFFLYPVLMVIPAILLLFVFYFFRHPARKIPEGNNIILSPADGTVIGIDDVPEPEFVKSDAAKITIFLSVFNVHINRAPCPGKVAWVDYKRGKYLVASRPEASVENERNSIGINAKDGTGSYRVMMRQIAGIIAQRIVCDCKVNDEVVMGQVVGMIKFGSRTEIFIPKDKVASLDIKMGDKVTAGETVIAHMK